jgi:hypothetical protein
MNKIKSIGMVIYSYKVIEDRSEELWEWLENVEIWAKYKYSEFVFAPRDKESRRIWKATPKNRELLLSRMKVEKPWSVINYGWPENSLRSFPAFTRGYQVSIKSREQVWKGGEKYRTPSYVSLVVHPEILDRSSGINDFLGLGIEAWEMIEGVYGFIDIETDAPLHDSLLRNFDHLMSNLVPDEGFQEFRRWQEISNRLNKNIWKVFWGNFLGMEHICQLGNLEAEDNKNRSKPQITDHLNNYERGLEGLLKCNCFYDSYDLSNKGLLLTLSSSPFDWYDSNVQLKRNLLQEVLAPVAISGI